MNEDERTRILNMVKDGKITVEEAAELLGALDERREEPAQPVVMKDTRGRKPKKLRVEIDGQGDGNKKANVHVNIPLSLVRSVGPTVLRNMPDKAKQKLDEKGIDLQQIFSDIDRIAEEGGDEDIVNIDAGDEGDGAKVRVYFE